ncbi:unnamed protein product [Heligmosomoides polygyrus]|uniref:RNA polymerase II subunit B1 CTD phosphatase RPAP2 homolog n=1 Tax=Heligmosomoides polygyrus TaxID=6339 RepID=A0A183FE33_HELPZ|nr:unnamed protein product [Heligmosomoides polygyrus]
METLKDSGIYNEIYMAPDIFTASKTFPDLGGKNFMKAKSRYQCDEKCERSSRLVRFVMTGEEPPEIPKVSERAWWDEEEWKQREQRSILGPNPTRRDRRKELEKTVRNALRELERMDHEDLESSGELSEQEEFDQFFSSELHPDDTLSPPRERRSASVELTMKNSGKARDILGTTIALECGNQRDDLQAGRVSSLIVYNQHEHDSCISARIELPTEGNMGMKNNWEPSISASRYPDAFQAALPRVPLHSGSLSSWLPSSDIKNRADCLG